MEVLVSGDPRDAKKMFVTGAGRFRECKNTELLLIVCMGVEKKMGFVKATVSRAVRLRDCPLGELLLYYQL